MTNIISDETRLWKLKPGACTLRHFTAVIVAVSLLAKRLPIERSPVRGSTQVGSGGLW